MSENQQPDKRYAYSKLTDTWYLVHEWEVLDAEKGQILSKQKEEVDREEVPQHWLDGVDERE